MLSQVLCWWRSLGLPILLYCWLHSGFVSPEALFLGLQILAFYLCPCMALCGSVLFMSCSLLISTLVKLNWCKHIWLTCITYLNDLFQIVTLRDTGINVENAIQPTRKSEVSLEYTFDKCINNETSPFKSSDCQLWSRLV